MITSVGVYRTMISFHYDIFSRYMAVRWNIREEPQRLTFIKHSRQDLLHHTEDLW